jgi:hypothetical protein
MGRPQGPPLQRRTGEFGLAWRHLHPAPRKRGRGTARSAVEGAWAETRRLRFKKSVDIKLASGKSQRHFPHVLRRQRSDESEAPSTALRAVPLPHLRRGGCKRKRSRDAFAPELCLIRSPTKREAERRQAQPSIVRATHSDVASRMCPGAEARPAGRARLSALHRGSGLGDRTPPLSLGPCFLESPGANGLPPSPGQRSELLADRS